MRYKVTRVFIVDAPTKAEARTKASAETLEYESIKELPKDGSGWMRSFKRQVSS